MLYHYVPTSQTKFHIGQTIKADSKDRNSFIPLRMALTMLIFIKCIQHILQDISCTHPYTNHIINAEKVGKIS